MDNTSLKMADPLSSKNKQPKPKLRLQKHY